jgi:cbb3-type cytochrome oxidase maturation protein
MSVLFILIITSLAMALFFLGAFVWSVKTGQFEDDRSPSIRMLYDGSKPNTKPNTK